MNKLARFFFIFLFSVSASYGLPITIGNNIKIDIQQPRGIGKLIATASVFKDHLVLGGDMTRPAEASILGRIHIVIYNAEGERLAERFVTPSLAGRRGENRRQFSSDFDFPESPANLKILVSYEEPGVKRSIGLLKH